MDEALGKYAEAKATEEHKNHLQVIGFLKNGELVRLNKLIRMNIGSDSFTRIAYPAAGSFMDFLIETYGLSKVKLGFQTVSRKNTDGYDPWKRAFDDTLEVLEKRWLMWLIEKYDEDLALVESFLVRDEQ
jgi:hypothetical protein